jgi:predicted AAA+ superfamily ATPase
LGARQVGKTTLARQIAASQTRATILDLEDPDQLARLSEPMLELRRHRGLIVLDEIQRRPELFPVLRVLADDRPLRRRFLVLGSASPDLLRQTSETLAGRVAFVEIAPFDITEMPTPRWQRLWLRGGFPRSYLASSDARSLEWRRQFRQTFLERDLPMLGLGGAPAATLGRYWTMLAHVHAQLQNWSELGRSMGVSDATARRYADLLDGTMMIRQVLPWHENIGKRQVKRPKLYFRDSGLLHMLLGIRTLSELETHPRVGASWEGFVIEQLHRALRIQRNELYFWRTEHGAELDALVVRGRTRIGFELKNDDAGNHARAARAD